MNMNDPKGTCDIVWLIMLSHVCGKLDRQVPELACQVAHCRGTKTKSQDVSSLDLSMGLRICWHNWAWKKRKGAIHNFTMNQNVCILSYAMFSCVFQLCSGFVVGIWFHLTSAQLQGQACQRPRAAAAPCRAAQVWFWCRMAMYGSVPVIPVLLYLTTRRFIMCLLPQMGPDIGTLSPAAPLRMSMRRAWVLFISQ